MKLAAAVVISILPVACSRAPAPPTSSSSTRGLASGSEAPVTASARPAPSQALGGTPRTLSGKGVSGVELSGEIVALAEAQAPSDELPLGTVMLGLVAPRAELAEWDLARRRIVRSSPWPDAVPMGEASFGLAKSGEGWVTVVSGDDAFSEPSRVTRLSSDLRRREWSRTLEPGMYPSVGADADTVAVSQQRPGRVELASFDARTGDEIASRSFQTPASVLTRLRPLADVVVAHGDVHASLPASHAMRVVRLSRKLTQLGELSLRSDVVRANAGYTPRLAPTADGLLVAHFEPSAVLELDAALQEKRRWDVALHDDDAIVAAPSGFVTAFGQGSDGPRFTFQHPDSWQGSDKGIFERRLIAVAHGRLVISVTCAGHTALMIVDQ